MIALFWISLFIIFYAFIGYGILLYFIIKVKRAVKGKPVLPTANNLPTCTLIVAAYNEERFIEEKIKNSLELNYPQGLLKLIFITDGSSDGTADIVAKYPQIIHMHSPERKGKMAAVHRAIDTVDTAVMVFTDANTFLNADAIVNICRHYSDPKVGAVAGEKRVLITEASDATAGEGFYWKYESKLKVWDSELYSVVGAAGELFSVRTDLYEHVPATSIIDDFMISMLIARKGYRIIYEPDAYAMETASEDVKEELKRKVRIAAGGLQSIIWLKSLLLPFKTPTLSFQYISHRVLRWTVVPFLMILLLVLNIILVHNDEGAIYQLFLAGQVMFYGMSIFGWMLEAKQIKVKIFFIPYYFCMMNYAVIRGIFRYLSGNQSAVWDKAKRK
ncbi:glycosyltransferase family 2 protein [Mucilaginibacter auburnensis]|uniref:Cellulose synthase/poly-beta-1,6-N-acetylglucosamine synthase-like glycosyltransferase n=1 Tax=Mucilaginibacter auburnensis TaxID=1457233 RepID=A0A2H9VVW4_9SPHI|nr:glycosyltransferase family 2 protein [Mucilaginibacter auburnensis]PJJ84960.1 cellulose synthase/poly-beta-1,6-N-acetylglucosamine synthase-like glycosyltransferase [Mucilaginibacter auburnensis]